jgi:S-layer homology domain
VGMPRVTRRWAVTLLTIAVIVLVADGVTSRVPSAAQAQTAEPVQPQTFSAQPEEPQATCPPGGQCFADVPSSNSFYEFVNRLYQQEIISGYPCGGIGEPCDPYNRPYYRPGDDVNRQQMAKFVDQARRQPGIFIETSTQPIPLYSSTTVANNGSGISGRADCSTCTGTFGYSSFGNGLYGFSSYGKGVFGISTVGSGVWGSSTSSSGVHGSSTSNLSSGVVGVSTNGNGVYGSSDSQSGLFGRADCADCEGVYGRSDNGVGVYGYSNSVTGNWAGIFVGNVSVTGTCCGAGAGTYRIDHPLDPANKYLIHSAVQSQEMIDIYNGNVTLDVKGEAWVQLPEWFESLNRNFTYQFAPIGAAMPDLHIAEEIKNNRFRMAGGKPNMKVSWQVTGIRHDPYAEAHPIQVEVEKADEERGKYLHPTEWGQPESAGIDYERQQQMRQGMEQANKSKP